MLSSRRLCHVFCVRQYFQALLTVTYLSLSILKILRKLCALKISPLCCFTLSVIPPALLCLYILFKKCHSPQMNQKKNCYVISWEHLRALLLNYSRLLPFVLVTETCRSIWGCVWSVGERILTEETRSTWRKKTCTLPHFPSQLSYGMSWYRKPAPAMTNRW